MTFFIILLSILLVLLILFAYNRLWFAFLFLIIRFLPATLRFKRKYKQDEVGKKDNSQYAFKILTKSSIRFCKIAGIKVETVNVDLLNKDYDDRLLVVGNHTSIIDVLVFQSLTTRIYRPVGKIELENLFSVHYLFKLMGMYFIDRKNLRESLKLLNKITSELIDDVPVLIYPEGTTADGEIGYREFKSGSFKPITTKGGKVLVHVNYDIYKALEGRKAFQWTTKVKVEFIEPIDVKEGDNTSELAQKVENIVVDKLKNYYGEVKLLDEYEF